MNQLATMWKLAGPARIPVVFGAVLRLAQSLCLGVAFGAAMSVVIHIVHDTTPSPREVVWIAALCVGSLIAQLCCGWAAARLSWLAAYQAVAHMRLQLLAHLREIPVNSLGKRSRGDIAALLSTDTQLIEDFLSEGLPRLGQALGVMSRDVVLAPARNDTVPIQEVSVQTACHCVLSRGECATST
ncbi:ABC transporter transmembrane domain-containing protein, partial [Corynebacterium diphtheriae]|uniref:ABC transporter transmembrane domain-containing protein n=1 Tax=Corynebacterium diphtheriae TaxID=1717 RepID=UPI001FD35209